MNTDCVLGAERYSFSLHDNVLGNRSCPQLGRSRIRDASVHEMWCARKQVDSTCLLYSQSDSNLTVLGMNHSLLPEQDTAIFQYVDIINLETTSPLKLQCQRDILGCHH